MYGKGAWYHQTTPHFNNQFYCNCKNIFVLPWVYVKLRDYKSNKYCNSCTIVLYTWEIVGCFQLSSSAFFYE